MFDKKKDFISLNSSIPTINPDKAYEIFIDEVSNNPSSNNIKLFITILSKSDYCLKRYHKFISSSDSDIKKLFFNRNKNYENLILTKKVKDDYSNNYFNCFLQEPNDLREEIFATEDIGIVYDYLQGFLSKIHKKNEVFMFVNVLIKLFSKGSKNKDEHNYIVKLSNLVNRRMYELEEFLYEDGNEDSLIDYANNHKFSNEKIINSIIKKGKEYNSFYRLERHISLLFSDKTKVKNIPCVEKLFIEGLEFSKDASYINTLMFYTKTLIVSKDFAVIPFYEGINILSNSITRIPSVICPFLQDIYSFCFRATLPVEWDKIERLELSKEKYFIESCNVSSDAKIQYIQHFNLSNNIEIEDSIIKSNDCSLAYKYSSFFNKRMPEAEITISRDYILATTYALERKVRMPEAESRMSGNVNRFKEYLNMLNGLHPDGIERLDKKLEKQILCDTDLSMVYVNTTKKNFIALENRLLKGLVLSQDMKGNIKSVTTSIVNIINYSKIINRRIKKMENVIFGVLEKINFYLVDIYDKGLSTDKNYLDYFVLYKTLKLHLISYIVNVVKKPLVEADNSVLKNEPNYIKFKERYEEERTTRCTRQRRKSNRVNPHQKSQSGQGQQTLVGEDTNI